MVSSSGICETVAAGPDLFAVVDVERPDACFAALVSDGPDPAPREVRVVGRGFPKTGYAWSIGPDGPEPVVERDPLCAGVLDRILLNHDVARPPRWAEWLGRLWLSIAVELLEQLTPSAWADDPFVLIFRSSPIALFEDLCKDDLRAPRPITPWNTELRRWLFGQGWQWAHTMLCAGAAPDIVPPGWANWGGSRLTAWALIADTPSWERSAAHLRHAKLDSVVEAITGSLEELGVRQRRKPPPETGRI